MKTYAIEYWYKGRALISVRRAKTLAEAISSVEKEKKIRLCFPRITLL